MRRRPGEAPPTHRVWLSPDQPYREGPASEGKSYFRLRLDTEPSPEWMRAYRAGLLGLLPEDREAVLLAEKLGFEEAFIDDIIRRVRENQYTRRLPLIAKLTSRTIDRDFRYPRDWGH